MTTRARRRWRPPPPILPDEPPPREPVISFEDVHLGFDEGDVLRGLSFHVSPQETKVLIGETGSGKTLRSSWLPGC